MTPLPQLASSTRIETPEERSRLAGVPTAKHPELLRLLRSLDHTVRVVALVLIQLDREDAARHVSRQQPQKVSKTKHAELRTLLHSSDHTVREVALLLIQLDREEAARRATRRRPQRVSQER